MMGLSTGGGAPDSFASVASLLELLADPAKAAKAFAELKAKADALQAQEERITKANLELTQKTDALTATKSQLDVQQADIAKAAQVNATAAADLKLRNDEADKRAAELDEGHKALDERIKVVTNGLNQKTATSAKAVSDAEAALERLIKNIEDNRKADTEAHAAAVAKAQKITENANQLLAEAEAKNKEAKALAEEHQKRLDALVKLAQGQ